MYFPSTSGGSGGGDTAGLNDQEAAMVKSASFIPSNALMQELTDSSDRCNEPWRAVRSRQSYLVAWDSLLGVLLGCSCPAYVTNQALRIFYLR